MKSKGKFDNKKKGNSKKFSQKPAKRQAHGENAVKGTIADVVSSATNGKTFVLTGLIDRIVQTGGPTVFYLSDGTGSLALKAFEGAGVRAHEEINESDAVSATIKVEEFRGEIEGDIIKIKKLSDSEKSNLLKDLERLEREKAEIEPPEFMVKDKILDKLKDRFVKAATEIRLAIFQNRPIIVRHHNDADGYSSGFALEKAILPLIEKQHTSEKAAWEFYLRAPCQAPFYEIDDSIRDTANSLRNVAKFSNKMPLIIIADNGSSSEDLLGIKQGKVHGADFIVVDHHVLGDKDVISSEVLEHINPFLVGESGEEFSAGMLCSELARFINPDVEGTERIAAMAGLADMIKNPEAIKQYLKLADDLGYDESLLLQIASVIDFVSKKLKFMEAREYIEVIFGEPIEKQRELVSLMGPYIKDLEAKGLEMGKAFRKVEKVGSINLQTIMMEEAFPGFGFYPRPGIVINMLHSEAEAEKKPEPVVSLGILSTAITIRATDSSGFSVQALIEHLNKKVPTAFVTGGGHANAGAINFIPIMQSQVLEETKTFVKSL